MKKKFVDYYMDVAQRTSELSYAKRLKVGAVIVNTEDNQMIATGYNGTPEGWDNECEYKEYCTGGGWLSPDEMERDWPYTEYDEVNKTMRRYRLKTKPEVLHAERNALDKLTKSTLSGKNATMIVTHSPCLECAKSIFGSGIKTLYYRDQYRDNAGLEFLEKANVNVIKYNEL